VAEEFLVLGQKFSVAKFLLKIQKEYGIILIIGGGPPNGAAESRTLRNSSSRITNNLPINPHIS
jgi:hypothetical protein